MIEYRYDTQLLIDGEDLDEDAINDYFVENFKGDCLLAVGDEDTVKIHYHTNEPWKILEYCNSISEINPDKSVHTFKGVRGFARFFTSRFFSAAFASACRPAGSPPAAPPLFFHRSGSAGRRFSARR